MMTVLYETAIWVQELASLTVADVRFSARSLRVLGKGGKERLAPLASASTEGLKAMMNQLHAISAPGAPLFYHLDNGRARKLSTDRIRKIVIYYAEKARRKVELPLNVHPHLFRASRAVHLLEDGMDVAALSKILGHESLASTRIYMEAVEGGKGLEAEAVLEDEKKIVY
jgi:site-specific recombinase XerD